MKLRILIVDDEPLARERIRSLLADEPDVEVLAECKNGQEALEVIKKQSPDLVFLDVQMPGMGGFEVLSALPQERMPMVIFVTAFDHHALKAFEVHALDYLTKPVEPERLQMTLARVRERIASKAALMTQEQMKAVLSSLESSEIRRQTYPKRLLVHSGTKNSFVSVNEIEWIEAADYYSCLHVGSKSYMLREPIKQLASSLNPDKFVRIHRSVIVNIEQVREIFREGKSEGYVSLTNGQRLRMSKVGWQNLLNANRK